MAPHMGEVSSSQEFDVGVYREQAADPAAYNRQLEMTGSEGIPKASYTKYLPTFSPDQKYPPLEPFEHIDRGTFADATFPDLLGPSVTAEYITPSIGTKISGIQLSSLTPAGKDQLALLTAQRKVLHFTNQDFADLPIDEAVGFASYFGKPHIHPTSGSPEGHPDVHMVYRGAMESPGAAILEGKTTTLAWHSDVSYEAQPPGTTFLYILDNPAVGGDTVFVDTAEAYNRLSPDFRKRLHGLQALHSGIEQVNASKARGSICRREPVANVHPLIRTHPATGDRSIFVNPQFVRKIIGYKQEESDMIIKFLNDHLIQGVDFQARIRWQKKSVIVMDNRVTLHTALLDWVNGERRYLARIAPQAERPVDAGCE